jgi:trigger factor
MQYPGREKEVIEHYKNNSSSMNALKGPIFENKVIQFFIDNAEVKDTNVTSDELNKKISKIEEQLNKDKKGK